MLHKACKIGLMDGQKLEGLLIKKTSDSIYLKVNAVDLTLPLNVVDYWESEPTKVATSEGEVWNQDRSRHLYFISSSGLNQNPKDISLHWREIFIGQVFGSLSEYFSVSVAAIPFLPSFVGKVGMASGQLYVPLENLAVISSSLGAVWSDGELTSILSGHLTFYNKKHNGTASLYRIKDKVFWDLGISLRLSNHLSVIAEYTGPESLFLLGPRIIGSSFTGDIALMTDGENFIPWFSLGYGW